MGGLGKHMYIYLPIAEVSVNIFLLFGLGGIVGVLSGIFGVGGGFLITPLLFFVGIPPAVAVATSANQIVASSVSGLFAHLKRKTVDLRMGSVLLAGGLVGSAFGIMLFNYLKALGQVDLLVQLCYVIFLGVIGGLMFIESLRAIRRARKAGGVLRKRSQQLQICHDDEANVPARCHSVGHDGSTVHECRFGREHPFST